jgi:Tol biopolymer transport system component
VTNLDEANILRAGVATGELTAVTASVNLQLFPDISPDGQRIVYQTSDETSKLTAGHLKLDLLTSAPTKYPQDLRLMGCFARWSPTGDQIAYLRRVGTSFELFRSSTAEPREVLVTSGGISMPGIGLAPFEMDYRPFDWARDGAALVYSAKRSDAFNLWRTGIDGHTEPLTAFDGSSRPTSPLYSPDGRKLAFIEALASGPALMAHGNNVDVIVDGQIRRLATFGRGVSLLNWDHAGEVVFAAVDAPGSVDVFAVSAESKRIVRLPNARRESVRLSPDARWVAYSVSRKSVENLCVTELMTSDERCVTSNDDPTVFFSGIVWAPDSKTVFFTKQTGGMQISLISLNHQENDPL